MKCKILAFIILRSERGPTPVKPESLNIKIKSS